MSRAYSYDVIKDFHVESDKGSYISSNSHWVVVTFPFGQPITYDRAKLGAISADFDAAAKLRRPPIIITDDCRNISIERSKGSYAKEMNLTLRLTNVNYMAEILPGDWIMAWLMHDKEHFVDLLERIRKLEPCNLINDGLKFIGRVHGPRMNIHMDRASGKKSTLVQVQCQSFSEMAASFFYDPNLQAANDKSPLQWLAKLGVLDKVFTDQFGKNNNANIFIPTIISIVLGNGAAKTTNTGRDKNGKLVDGPADLLPAAGAGTAPGAPAAYVLPSEVGKLMGASSSIAGKDYYTFADLLEVQIGVERYEDNLVVDGRPLAEDLTGLAVSMTPGNIASTKGNTIHLDTPILGRFYFPPTFSNRSVWQQCQQFLNPAVNEMFTSLKIGANGSLTQALTVRQIPFTTDAYHPPTGAKETPVTRFLDLPRWKISPLMVESLNIGRSDATRINYVHVYGNAYSYVNAQTVSQQMGVNPPIRDDLDIIRNGVRTLMQTVECDVTDDKAQEHTQRTWMSLIADWSMNSHLTLNGTLECVGIQSPISEGQNVEFDGVVYHVEAISESASISPDGHKSWTTRLSLSNGLLDNERTEGFRTIFPTYAGLAANQVNEDTGDAAYEGNVEEILQVTSEHIDAQNAEADLQVVDNIARRLRPGYTKA